MLHKDVGLGDVHRIQNWEVADLAALNALVVVADDEGKFARRLDNGQFYYLTDHTGPDWALALGGVATIVAGANITVDATDPLNPIVASTGGGGGGGGRTILAADTTYYVRTDGNDANTGLTDSSGGAFLTIQKAVDVIAHTVDTAGYQVTIQIKDGSYAAGAILKPTVGSLIPIIQGNAVTPANVHVNIVAASTSAFVCGRLQGSAPFNIPGDKAAQWILKNFKITCTQISLWVNGVGNAIYHSGLDFGVATLAHINSASGATVYATGNYTISGTSSNHITASQGGRVHHATLTVTFTANMVVNQFILLSSGSYAMMPAQTYTLGAFTVTGQRYNAAQLSLISGTGAGASYFPGSTGGAVATGALYL